MLGEFCNRINWVDVLAAILLVRAVYIGSSVGLSAETFKLAGILSSLIFAIHGYQYLAGLMGTYASTPPALAQAVSFLAIAIAFPLLFKLLRSLSEAAVKLQFADWLNKFGGILLGLARGVITTSILLMFLSILPSEYLKSSINDRSFSGRYFIRSGVNVYGLASRICPKLNQEVELLK